MTSSWFSRAVVQGVGVSAFLDINQDLLPLINKLCDDCSLVFGDAELILEMLNDRCLGLLIKCSEWQQDMVMDLFFEFEELGWRDLMFAYSGRFVVDIYGLHLLREHDV